jgi:hypothetical protein
MNLTKTRIYARNSETSNIAVRLNKNELKTLNRKAKKFTQGNMSEFIRQALLAWDPVNCVSSVSNASSVTSVSNN